MSQAKQKSVYFEPNPSQGNSALVATSKPKRSVGKHPSNGFRQKVSPRLNHSSSESNLFRSSPRIAQLTSKLQSELRQRSGGSGETPPSLHNSALRENFRSTAENNFSVGAHLRLISRPVVRLSKNLKTQALLNGFDKRDFGIDRKLNQAAFCRFDPDGHGRISLNHLKKTLESPLISQGRKIRLCELQVMMNFVADPNLKTVSLDDFIAIALSPLPKPFKKYANESVQNEVEKTLTDFLSLAL